MLSINNRVLTPIGYLTVDYLLKNNLFGCISAGISDINIVTFKDGSKIECTDELLFYYFNEDDEVGSLNSNNRYMKNKCSNRFFGVTTTYNIWFYVGLLYRSLFIDQNFSPGMLTILVKKEEVNLIEQFTSFLNSLNLRLNIYRPTSDYIEIGNATTSWNSFNICLNQFNIPNSLWELVSEHRNSFLSGFYYNSLLTSFNSSLLYDIFLLKNVSVISDNYFCIKYISDTTAELKEYELFTSELYYDNSIVSITQVEEVEIYTFETMFSVIINNILCKIVN